MEDDIVGRPGLLVAAEILSYVIGGICILGAIADDSSGSIGLFLLGGGIVAAAIGMRKGMNWARVTLTVLTGLLIIVFLEAGGEDDTTEDEANGILLILAAAVCVIVFSWVPKVNQWFRLMSSRQCLSSGRTPLKSAVCGKCGMPVSSDSKFCIYCGTAVEMETGNKDR